MDRAARAAFPGAPSLTVRVALFGYYGFGNLGDEAVLQAALRHLREEVGGLEAWVLSADPAWTEAVHGVRAVRRTDLQAVRRAFLRADVVCSGGGSLFQDVTSWRSPLFYGLLHELARSRPVVVYAQGVGPLRRRLSRAVTRRAMHRAAVVTVRDRDSAALLRQLGVARPVEVVCDPALDLSPRRQGPVRDVLAVSVRPWPQVRWEQLAQALGRAARGAGLSVRVVCLHPNVDLPASRQLAAALSGQLVVPPTPQDALDELSDAHVAVGMRLHFLVLAASAGVPFVGVAYDPKVSSFADSVGCPWLPAHSLDSLEDLLKDLVQDPAAPGRVREAVAGLRPLARRPAQLARQVAGGLR